MTESTDTSGRSRGDDGGSPAATGERTVRLDVPGMDCPSCAVKIDRAVASVAGVSSHETRPAAGTVAVSYDPAVTTESAVVDAVRAVGYDVGADGAGRHRPRLDRATGVTAASALLVVSGLALEFVVPGADVRLVAFAGTTLHAADVLFLVAISLAARGILADGIRSVRARSLDMDLLMSTAIVGALLASLGFGEALYFEAAALAVLFRVAERLERYSMDRARRSVRDLVDRTPTEARVKRAGETATVPVSTVEVGDVVVVRPGERIPVDGTVVDGESAVDQAPVTGESAPVTRSPGDEVYAGTIVEGGYLAVETTVPPGEDTISRAVELVEAARAGRSERDQFVDRFASYYTPAVVLLAFLTAVGGPLLFGATLRTAVVNGLTLLVLACPCAFVISTPVSVVSAVTSAATHGVLVTRGDHLEAVGEVDVVAFDKTGTLTKGALSVTDVVPLNGNTEADVLRCARGLERRSEHPIGEAIVAKAGDGAAPTVEDFEAIAGKGVRADLDGTPHVAGTPALFEELGFDLSHVHAATAGDEVTAEARDLCDRNDCLDLLEETVPDLQAQGKTVVLVGRNPAGSGPQSGAVGGELEGLVAVADELRPEAKRVVSRLRDLGVERTVMLTGDNERTARAVAEQVGVDEYRAGLLPEDKVAAAEELATANDGVMMVGDGINDAPALAAATVGVAMGAAGSDAAIEAADVALLGDDLSKLPYLRELAARTTAVIRENVLASLAVKAALVLAVPFGYVPIWLAVLAGDVGMTLGVTGNAMGLAGVVPDEFATEADG